MDSFEFNKIFASILIALLIAMGASLISDFLVKSDKLDKNVLVIQMNESTGTPTASAPSLEPVTPLLAKANVDNGEAIAKKCYQCHTTGKGEPHKVGPNLWNIVLNKLAHAADYAYSSTLKEKHDKETWTYEKLNHFLYKPREFAPGTKMSFAGLSSVSERADLIAYLRKQNDNPPPLP